MPSPPVKTKYPDPTTEGQRLLQAATRGRSLTTIARDLSLGTGGREAISNWLNGVKRPKPGNRAAIWDRYQIPVGAWDLKARGTSTQLDSTPPPPVNGNGHSNGAPAHVPSTLDDCLAVLAKIRTERDKPDLLASERIKLADSEARLLVLRNRLERDRERLEDRIVREHPAWKRLLRLMVEVLTRHPAALADMATALEQRLEDH